MNKKTLIFLLAAVVLILVVGIVIAVFTAPAKVPDGGTEALTEATADTTEETNVDSTAPQADTQPVSTTDPSQEPDIELGVGERGDYGTEQTEPSQDKEQDKPQTGNTDKEEQTTATESTAPSGDEPKILTWAEYKALSDVEQEAYYESFEDNDDFMAWWQAAQKGKEDGMTFEIVDGKIDLGKITP